MFLLNYSENPGSLYTPGEQFFIIDSILIAGNDITKEFIILRELDFEIGDTINFERIEFNKERVYSLGIFNFVDFNLSGDDQYKSLEIVVHESWYIFPLPFFTLRENSFEKSSYGLKLTWKNFRGRNENVRAIISLGYDPAYIVNYYNPLLVDDHDVSLGFSFSYSDIANKSERAEVLAGYEFDYKVKSADIYLGKRINNFNEIFLAAGVSDIKSPLTNNNYKITASGDSNETLLYGGIQYLFDSRNLKQHANNGIYLSANFFHKGFGIQSINYNVYTIDFREYRKVAGKLASKWRILYREVFGATVPYYDYSFLGIGEYVRGHSNEDREGLKLFLTSLEFNYSVIRDFDFSFKLPLIPKKLTSAKLSIYTDVFGDAGITYDNINEIKYAGFSKGWGFGVTFLFLPYKAFRFAYAFNEREEGEIIFGTGFSF
ncbi:MAG: POTRA domain-containing protein [Ignavibacteria bacterium]